GTTSLFPQVLSGILVRNPATGAPLLIGDYAVNITVLPDFNGVPNILRGGAAPRVIPLIYTMDPDAKTDYTIQSSVGVAHSLTPDMAVTLDFQDAVGRNELVTVDTNAPTRCLTALVDGFCPQYDPTSRPLPFGPIRTFKTIGESDYKAVSVGFQRRYADGWQL